MKRIIAIIAFAVFGAAMAKAATTNVVTNAMGVVYTYIDGKVTSVTYNTASDTNSLPRWETQEIVSPYNVTPDTNDGVIDVGTGGTYVIDPDETAGTVTNTLSAASHGQVLRLVVLPATNTFVIAEGSTAQISGGTITPALAGTNTLVELWGVGATWREANSSTLVE